MNLPKSEPTLEQRIIGVMSFRHFKPEAWEEISRWWMTRSGRNHRRIAVISRALERREKSSNQLMPLQGA